MKNIVTIIVFVFCFLSLKAQTIDISIIDSNERNYYKRLNDFNFLKMDKIGDYNISFFIIGEVELDSLINVSYEYQTTDRNINDIYYRPNNTFPIGYSFVTFEKNISLIASTPPEKLHELLQQKDMFKLELEPYIIKYSVAPQCTDTLKQQLNQMMTSTIASIYGVKYSLLGESIYLFKDVKKKCHISYRKIVGTNKFLLLLMNRTWRESANHYYFDPPQEQDPTNTYIKYLIPLY